MKKIKLLLPILVLISILSFSFLMKPSASAATVVPAPTTDEAKVDASLNNINIRSTAIASFPLTYKSGFEGVTITWESDNQDAIDVSKLNETGGWAIVNRSETEPQTATLTVTVKLGDTIEKSKSQLVTVPAGKTTTASYEVAYDFGELTDVVNEVNPTAHEAGKYVKLETPTKDGYTFVGWYSDAAYTKEMTCLPVGMYKNITVYGKFEKNKTVLSVDMDKLNITNEFTYDGSPHNVVIGGVDDKIDVSYEDNTLTNAGQKEVQVTFSIKEEYADDYVLEGETTKTVILKVNPRAITVKADNKTSVYGEPLKELTYTVEPADGIVYGETLEFNLTKLGKENVSEYQITISPKEDYSNYEIKCEEGTYSITKRPLKITFTPETITIICGAELPSIDSLELTYDGFYGTDGDALKDLLAKKITISYGSLTDTNLEGEYPFVIAVVEDFKLDNYEIIFDEPEGTLKIVNIYAEVDQNNLTTIYNGSEQGITISNVTFWEGDTNITDKVNNPTISYSKKDESTMESSYPINAGEYIAHIEFIYDGKPYETKLTYTISAQAIQIGISTVIKTYDGKPVELIYTELCTFYLIHEVGYTEITDASKKMEIATVVLAAKMNDEPVDEPTDAGTYNITGKLEKINSNYSVKFIDDDPTGTIQIDPRELTLTVGNASVVYSGKAANISQADYNFSYEVTNNEIKNTIYVDNEEVGGTITFSLVKEAINAGTYGEAITASIDNNSSNYKITDVIAGTLTITKAKLTATIDGKTITRGAEFPNYTYTLAGFVDGEDETVIKVVDENLYAIILGTTQRLENTETTGEYGITGTITIEEGNYYLEIVDGRLIIDITDAEKVQKDTAEINTIYEKLFENSVSDIPNLMIKGTNGTTITWHTTDTDLVKINNETGEITIINVDGNTITFDLTAIIKLNNALAYSELFTVTFEFEKGTENNPYNAEEAVEIVKQLSDKVYSEEKYYVEGIVSGIETDKYLIKTSLLDDSAQVLTIYKATLTGVTSDEIVIGSKIKAVGHWYSYNSTPELSGPTNDPAQIIQVTFGDQEKLDADTASLISEMNSISSLTGNTKFDPTLTNGSTVAYKSTNEAVLTIDEEGIVTVNRPTEGSGDITVIVKYTVSLNGLSSKEYSVEIIVKEESSSIQVGKTTLYELTQNKYSETIGTDSNLTLVLSAEPTYKGWDKDRGLQIGSNKKPQGEFTITASQYTAGIAKIKIKVCTGGTATVSVTVGGISLVCGDNTSITATSTPAEYEFITNNNEVLIGTVVISINASTKAFYFSSLQIN